MPEKFLVKTKFCEQCGATIPVKIVRDYHRKRFCSRVCQYNFNKASGVLINPWGNPDTVSKMKLHMRKPHTITVALLKASKERGLKRLGQHIKGEERACDYCGKVFYAPTCRLDGRILLNGQVQRKKFCSNECRTFASRKANELKTDKVRLKEWAVAVKERDNFTCVDCGCARKRLLQSHHKITKEDNTKLWYEVANGETLCVYCHIKRHKKSLTGFILSAIHLRRLERPYEQRI